MKLVWLQGCACIARVAVADPSEQPPQLDRLGEATASSIGPRLVLGGIAGLRATGLRAQVDLLGTQHLEVGLSGLFETTGSTTTTAAVVYLAASANVYGPFGARVQLGVGVDDAGASMLTALPLHIEIGALASIVLGSHAALVAGPLVERDATSMSSLFVFGGLELH